MEQNSFTEFDFEGLKNSSAITCDSQLLFDYLLWLEWDPKVESYFQPLMEVGASNNGREFFAKIDLWIEYNDRNAALIQILDAETNRLYSNNPDLRAQVKYSCQSFNMDYMAVSEQEVKKQPLCFNLKRLWRFAGWDIHLGHKVLVKNFFSTERIPTVGKLKAFLKKFGFPAQYVYTFIFHKIILADIHYFPVTDETPIVCGSVAIRSEHTKPWAASIILN